MVIGHQPAQPVDVSTIDAIDETDHSRDRRQPPSTHTLNVDEPKRYSHSVGQLPQARSTCRSGRHRAQIDLIGFPRAVISQEPSRPNSPSRGVAVAFIEVNGAPIELMEIDHEARPDLSLAVAGDRRWLQAVALWGGC